MLARLRHTNKDDEGFTLIELLVVVIIIGILAAVAIPTFLKQREKGYLSAMRSDVKNAVTAEESYATDNNGTYLAYTTPTDPLATDVLKTQGFNRTPKVSLVVKLVSTTGYTICSSHEQLTGATGAHVLFDSANGQLTTVDNCPV